MQKRIIGIDLARGFAILLVMWKHSLASYGGIALMPAWSQTGLTLLMQLATPAFLLLFGIMLELVYLPRMQRGKVQDTAARLRQRAFQCYGYYALAVVAFFFFAGTYSAKALPFALTGFISVPFSHLLAFYTLALAAAPLLLSLRMRHGLLPLVLFAVVLQAAHPLITQLPPAPLVFGRQELQHLSGTLYGQGVDFNGPSFIHGMAIVCIGMAFGSGVSSKSSGSSFRDVIGTRSIIVMLGALVCLLLATNWQDPAGSFSGLLDASLRKDSHPLYFAFGLLGAMVMVCVFVYLYDVLKVRTGRFLQLFGRRSLFTFGIGNILAHLAPAWLGEVLGGVGATAALFSFVCVLAFAYDQLEARNLNLRRLATYLRSAANRDEIPRAEC